MKRALLAIALMLMVFLNVGNAYGEEKITVVLTDMEKAYIASKGPIKLVVDPDWYPYEQLDKDGNYKGIAPDLIALMSERTGLKFEILHTADWKDTLEKAKSGEADVISFLNKSEERSRWLLFTEPYFIDPNVLITREEHDYITNLSRHIHETMVLPEGTSIEERIRRDYPELKILIVKSEEDAIQYIEDKKADVTLRSLTMAAYIIKNEGRFNLKIAGEIPNYQNQLRMGITKQDKMLQGILNKAVATITEEDVQDAINNHISIKVMKGFDYKLFVIVFSVFSFILGSTLYGLRRIHVLNRKLRERQDALIATSEKLEKSEGLYRRIAEELESKNKLLIESATTDVLTGLKNRLYFNHRVSEEMERFKRYGINVSLLIIDIDHFKRINDTYGHDVGDDVLRKMGVGLQSDLRMLDLLARWGGEEFIVLLPECELDNACIVADKLRKKAEELIYQNDEKVTISLGVSTLLESDTLETWLKRTDKALYHAKRQGRNRYCVSSTEVEAIPFEMIKWDLEWNSGHSGIDHQHMELLTICNRLIDKALNEDANRPLLPELVKVVAHIQKHFEYEEGILAQCDYAELETHEKSHAELLDKAKEMLKRSDEGRLLPTDVAQFIINDLVIGHLIQEDAKFFSLVKEC